MAEVKLQDPQVMLDGALKSLDVGSDQTVALMAIAGLLTHIAISLDKISKTLEEDLIRKDARL